MTKEYETFKEQFLDELEKLAAQRGFEIQVQKTMKDARPLTGVMVVPEDYVKGYCPAAVDYIEDIFERFADPKAAAKDTLISLVAANGRLDQREIGKAVKILEDKQSFLDNLVARVTYAKNMSDDVPHVMAGDMAIGCSVVIKEDENEVQTTRVSRELLNHLKISEGVLFETAINNTARRWPEKLVKDRPGMYVVTASGGIAPSVAMFYPGVLKKISKWLSDDLLIVPVSSEAMVACSANMYAQDIDKLINVLVAASQEEEKISQQIYLYSAKEQKLDAVAGYELK